MLGHPQLKHINVSLLIVEIEHNTLGVLFGSLLKLPELPNRRRPIQGHGPASGQGQGLTPTGGLIMIVSLYLQS